MIPTLSTGGSVLQDLGHAALVYGGRMLPQTHDAIMLNVVTLLQHVFSFDVHFFNDCSGAVEKGALVSYTKSNSGRQIHVNGLN